MQFLRRSLIKIFITHATVLSVLVAFPLAQRCLGAPELTLQAKQKKFSLILEPYLGYQGLGMVTEKSINASFVTSTGSYYGALIGGRGLIEIGKFAFAGLDAGYAPHMGYSSATGGSPINNSTWELRAGALLGLNVSSFLSGLPMRVWFGYGFLQMQGDKNNTTNNLSSTPGEMTLSGYSLKAGTSYQISRIFAVNLEYLYASYSSIRSDALSPGSLKDYALPSTEYFGVEHVSNKTFIFSLSAPFNFIL